jgi:predicted metal-dependent phosphoesterase TrpH
VIDLHAHSNASDGVLAPAAVVHRATEAGVGTLALTDHDTVGGLDEAVAAAAESGIRLIPGMELSVRFRSGTFHLLGYFSSTTPRPLLDRIEEIGGQRDWRNRQIVSRLNELGVPLEWSAVRARAKGRLGRPHIADAIVEAGFARDRSDAFARYIGAGRPAYEQAGLFEPLDAVSLYEASGAAVSLAHPSKLNLPPEELDTLIGQLVEVGLDGIEVHRGDHTQAERDTFGAVAARHGLLPTGGSDFHDPSRQEGGRRLGNTGPEPLDPDVVEEFLARRSVPAA